MWLRDVMVAPPEWLPVAPTMSNYLRILGWPALNFDGTVASPVATSPLVKAGLLNSAIVAGVVALVTVAVSSPVAYSFARFEFRKKNTLLFTLLFSRTIPPVAIAIPYYYLYNQWRLIGTHLGLIIIYLVLTIPISAWVLMGFFGGLPRDVERAARVDGLGRWGALRRVIFPMAASGIASIGILAFLLAWNEYALAVIITSGFPAQTLPPTLTSFYFHYNEITFMNSAATLSLIPPFIVAVIFQRYITRLRIIDPVALEIQ